MGQIKIYYFSRPPGCLRSPSRPLLPLDRQEQRRGKASGSWGGVFEDDSGFGSSGLPEAELSRAIDLCTFHPVVAKRGFLSLWKLCLRIPCVRAHLGEHFYLENGISWRDARPLFPSL